MTATSSDIDPKVASYRVTGMDCSSCAAKIERTVRGVAGVGDVKVSMATQIMTLSLSGTDDLLASVERAVTDLGYKLDRLDRQDTAQDADALSKDLSHIAPAYKRVLWIAMILNTSYGVIEMGGGFWSGSQAVKADALDFLGDGLITLLGLIAIGWGLAWRARSALIQGLFLGAIGCGVLVATIYRVIVQHPPEAELMGLFGFTALIVNVAAALILIPHRKGDANVRAVWMFSRNDAIGNVAVVIAASLVAWSGSALPDLVVAFSIACLFLHSAWSIIRDAKAELQELPATV